MGERFSFAGEVLHRHRLTRAAQAGPAPAPADLIGGRGPRRTPRLAARYADEYNAQFASAVETEAAYGRVREACEAAGRDPGSLVYSAAHTVCCGRDEAELARRAGAIGWDLATQRADGLVGTPGEIVDRIGSFAGLGATRIYLQVMDLHDLDHLELIASEGVPGPVGPALPHPSPPGPAGLARGSPARGDPEAQFAAALVLQHSTVALDHPARPGVESLQVTRAGSMPSAWATGSAAASMAVACPCRRAEGFTRSRCGRRDR